MKRLHLSVDNLEQNFAISNRSKNLGLDHLGIQADDEIELQAIKQQLNATQAPIEAQEGAACCYTRSDKYWVTDPQGIAWESFHSLKEIPTFNDQSAASDGETPYACRPALDDNQESCCE